METRSPAASGPVPTVEPCPRCRKPLADPRGLGWCQACGYCRSLEEDRARLPLEKPAVEPEPSILEPPAPKVSAKAVAWPIVLFVGVLLIAVATFVASRHFQLTAMQRAVWTTIQIFAGVAMVLIGQCYALILLAPKDSAMNFTDAIVPFRLYGLVFRTLPRMCPTLWLASWGLALVFSALICVGGLSHWLTKLPKSSQSQYTQ